jgi:hypothetical protein
MCANGVHIAGILDIYAMCCAATAICTPFEPLVLPSTSNGLDKWRMHEKPWADYDHWDLSVRARIRLLYATLNF